MIAHLRLLVLIIFIPFVVNSQKVGLVLSGGGAYGMGHIGVIKALEENGIPIDYITGTSAGAIIGSMYAAGYSPDQMKIVVSDPSFARMSAGEIQKKYRYFFKQPLQNASWIKLNLSKQFDLNKSLPTNFTNSAMLDFSFFENYSAISAKAAYNFDSLFVPFRCVASDIVLKKDHVFKKGHLSQAVRASMTYPGYLKPIFVEDKLMFDGGLYNNFPSEVMYDEFMPDVIIGVNFSDTIHVPDQDDVISQIKAMVINRDDMTIPCEQGIIIHPKFQIGLFDFSNAKLAIDKGYEATNLLMDSISSLISRRVPSATINAKRASFRKGLGDIFIQSIKINGLEGKKELFARKALLKKDEKVSIDKLKLRYFRLLEDERVSFLYPLLNKDSSTGSYDMNLSLTPQKPFSVEFGGVFSSKPINTGFIGLKYMRLGEVALSVDANSYFGKFYGSLYGGLEADFYLPIRFRLKVFGVLNRWDYFRSFSTFFEDVRPSFIVEYENFGGAKLEFPVFNRGKFGVKHKVGNYDMQYYQNEIFSASDTADATQLFMNVSSVYYEESSLNKKQFPTEGSYLVLKAKQYNIFENTIPGSTSPLTFETQDKFHQWYSLHGKYERYFNWFKNYSIGLHAEAHWMWVTGFLDNYTATIISAPSFQPILETRALYLPENNGHDITALGLKNIFQFSDNISLRIEGYLLQHYTKINSSSYNLPFYDISSPFKNRNFIGSAAFVFETPIGPISATSNYIKSRNQPWSFMLNFGYLMYNERLAK